MKKVLFVINTLGGAGAEKALLELLPRFRRKNMRYRCLFSWDRGN